jgi:hypothetical protein
MISKKNRKGGLNENRERTENRGRRKKSRKEGVAEKRVEAQRLIW